MLNSYARHCTVKFCLTIFILVCCGMFCNLVLGQTNQAIETADFQVERIAHAGGGYKGQTYTNSYQALSTNLELGFVYFELDFVFTSDNQLVCLHDWGESFKRVFKSEAEPLPTLEQFEALAANNPKFTNCTAQGLAEWMRQNPSVVIVSDVKDNNLVALKHLHNIIPNPNRRLIPQIYQPEEFLAVKALGYQQIIWTLYRFRGSDDAVTARVAEMQSPLAVAMPTPRAEAGLPLSLGRLSIPTYVHTINDLAVSERFLAELNVSEVYTDFLLPAKSVK